MATIHTYKQLQTFYQDYILSINSGAYTTGLSEFIHDQPVYNGEQLSLSQYQNKIDRAFEHLQNAKFDVDLIALDVEQQRIAARIAIHGTLVKPFLGLSNVGQSVLIHEHVFYLLRDGKVAEVRTLLVTN